MLTDTLYRQPRAFGVQQLQKRGEGGARELTSSRLRLAAGATCKYQIAGEETVLVLQEGTRHVRDAGRDVDAVAAPTSSTSAPAPSTCRPASR